jgi:alanyl-tRNA synthetase
MVSMTSREIRNSFLSFFKERGHAVVPSAPVIPHDDPTLLFTNAGMNQFKDVFLGTGKRSYVRAVDTQKCIRVSGKHNDLEEVGRDTYHHTFFEMLGNWSFGDYYKKEAIAWAWELLTGVWGLPKERLWATVYKDDDEAEKLWKEVTDIDPSHVLRFDEKDNFWEMGETGPCGPCSEIHMDRTPGGTAAASMVNAGTPDVIEIWNLVFIQYDRDQSGKLTPLPAMHVDTGMGFERICAVLQQKSSNYDTDVFTPIINAISSIAGKPYDGRMSGAIPREQMETDTAMRVVADHVRTLTFAIGDGAIPSNEGRGYVLRRILRRAARFGRNLGMQEPFIYRLVPILAEHMSYIFPEIEQKKDHIQRVIKAEEEGFSATLDRGLEVFEEVWTQVKGQKAKVIGGEDAFRLYDTFGFPLDLTELMAKERNLSVDVQGFNRLLEEQRNRSRESGKSTSAAILTGMKKDAPPSVFTGYERLEDEAVITGIAKEYLTLDKTPFYAESGGQIGDTGNLVLGDQKIRITDTMKDGGVIVHKFEGKAGFALAERVIAKVDKDRRNAIMRNHTATHLVHEALRRILGNHVHQSGSLVAPDHLRFDFNHFEKVTPEQLQAIEEMVNEKIFGGIDVVAINDPGKWVTIEEAKKRWPNVKMFFGEKYGEKVRVVEIDPQFSVELCGGTHVKDTSEIGYFRFRSEGSVASGTRRIEAVTADHALELLKLRDKEFGERLEYAFGQLEEATRLLAQAAGTLPDGEKDLKAIEQALEHLKRSKAILPGQFSFFGASFRAQDNNRRVLEEIVLRLADIHRIFERESSRVRLQSFRSDIDDLIGKGVRIDGLKLVTAQVGARSMDELQSFGDTVRSKLGSGVGVLASVADGKVVLVCVVTDDLVAAGKLQAGKIVGAVARLVGGGGGGRPHMATAGGKDAARLPEALRSVESIVRTFLH